MPALREDKPPWSAVPPRLRTAVEEVLGSRVVRGVRAYGGYGPSATFVLTGANGSRAFFKGTYPLPEGSAVQWSLEQEDRVYRLLGKSIQPWAPAYLGAVRADGWHAILLEHLGGQRALPWTRTKAMHAARSYARFHSSTLGRRLPRWISHTQHREFADYWRRLGADKAALDRLAGLTATSRREATRWLTESIGSLAEAERALENAGPPFALLHFDTRSDNIRLQGDLLRIFDWPMVSAGPLEFDLAAFAQSIEAEGGPSCEDVVDWYAEVLPFGRETLVGAVAGISGYFADRAPRPTLPGLPRLRAIQRTQLVASLGWAARLLKLPAPAWLDNTQPA